jgi:hypothetical protein
VGSFQAAEDVAWLNLLSRVSYAKGEEAAVLLVFDESVLSRLLVCESAKALAIGELCSER